MPDRTQLLVQVTLVNEPDLQHFIDLVMHTVDRLQGSTFLVQQPLHHWLNLLRHRVVLSGAPFRVDLLLDRSMLQLDCAPTGRCGLLSLPLRPSLRQIQQLRQELLRSLQFADPDALLQRNLQMQRYFQAEREKAEHEFALLRSKLKARQQALEEATLMAETDGLTGLLNRRSFDMRLKQAFLHVMRQRHTPLSLILLDLDYFKQVNDCYGHQYGDDYLNRMADSLREVIREDVDMAFRFGGDEFAVLLFADSAQAGVKSEQVLAAMAEQVSIGISEINPQTPADFTLEQFIRQADLALYQAKDQGRGQVVISMQGKV